jgi:hypothetical protein
MSALVVFRQGAVVDSLTAWFRAHGLETGPAVGISFAITAPVETFAELWPEAADLEMPVAEETALPVGLLPDDVSPWLDSVVLTPPPDFGPTGP